MQKSQNSIMVNFLSAKTLKTGQDTELELVVVVCVSISDDPYHVFFLCIPKSTKPITLSPMLVGSHSFLGYFHPVNSPLPPSLPPSLPPCRYMVDAADHEKLDAAKNELHSLLDKPQLSGIPVSKNSRITNCWSGSSTGPHDSLSIVGNSKCADVAFDINFVSSIFIN